jgi:hypothetical protein
MELTGKAKELFEKWYLSDAVPNSYPHIVNFYGLDDSLQWGVLQDFADSLGYSVGIAFKRNDSVMDGYEDYHSPFIRRFRDDEPIAKDLFTYTLFKTREEARTAAIKKLDEILNK